MQETILSWIAAIGALISAIAGLILLFRNPAPAPMEVAAWLTPIDGHPALWRLNVRIANPRTAPVEARQLQVKWPRAARVVSFYALPDRKNGTPVFPSPANESVVMNGHSVCRSHLKLARAGTTAMLAGNLMGELPVHSESFLLFVPARASSWWRKRASSVSVRLILRELRETETTIVITITRELTEVTAASQR